MTGATLPAASPCIGICRLHADARFCIGCGRTGDEITTWRDADDGQREAIISTLPARLSSLDVVPTRTVAAPQRVHAFLREALCRDGGAVVVGCHGAVAEFMAPAGERVRLTVVGNNLVATATGGALRLDLSGGLTLFEPVGDEASKLAPVLVAAPAGNAPFPEAAGLTRIGVDLAPIGPCGGDQEPIPAACSTKGGVSPTAPIGEGAILFDLGLGHASVRFMVRTRDPALIDCLEALEGAPLEKLLAVAGQTLVEASPDRVVETPRSRVEVTTAIPPPGGQSPVAPHTHLLPGALALGRLLPPGIACPAGFAPAALIYPGTAAQ
ncbi:MAG: DUF1289 domain-containing protein [Pseudomonadota bacterium]